MIKFLPKLLLLLVAIVVVVIEGGKSKEKKRVKVTAPAPSGRRFYPHNYTDLLSPEHPPWGIPIFRSIDHNNFCLLSESPGFSRQQRFIAEVMFSADDTCYHNDPLGGPAMEDPAYLELLELSGGGWGGVGIGPAPTDSCGPTYTNGICFQYHLAKRAVRDPLFHGTPNSTIQICQEGFNTGREAYVWLAADPGIKLLAFDVERDATYVRKAAELITKKFGSSRFEFISGNETQYLMPEFLSTHRQFSGCDIISFTGTTPKPCDRASAIRTWRKLANEIHFILADNTGCGSSFCTGPTEGLYSSYANTVGLYLEQKVSYHETSHRAKHNGAFKIVNAPRICTFQVLVYNLSKPLPANFTNTPCP